jgi:hypothetical protein
MVAFSLNGNLKYVDTPNLFCTFLNDIRFGININKQCRIFAKELTNREMNFFVPYLLYNAKGKLFLSALPVFIKNKVVSIIKNYSNVMNLILHKSVKIIRKFILSKFPCMTCS